MRAGAFLGMVSLTAVAVAGSSDYVPDGAREPQKGPVVVELFTSQGCSSCPPAEAVLGELSGRADVIAVAFHVDYWDGGGWRDRYSIPDAVRRQHAYTRELRLSSAFTPQAVVDGRTSLVGSDRRSIAATLAEPPAEIPLSLEIVEGSLRIEVPERRARDEHDVNIVAYLSQATTAVGRGENAGRTLTEYNIVRGFATLGKWSGAARHYSVPLSSLPKDADRVAVFVQRANQGPMAGAAALPLPR